MGAWTMCGAWRYVLSSFLVSIQKGPDLAQSQVTKLAMPQEHSKRSKDVGHTKAPRELPSAKCYRRHSTRYQARAPEEIAGLGHWV